MSVTWEFVELATKYFIPNFAECWWYVSPTLTLTLTLTLTQSTTRDQLILDVLLCNGLGIECGLFLARQYFDNDPTERERDWFGKYDLRGILNHFKRFMRQFTPLSLSDMRWNSFSSIARYYQIHLLIAAEIIMEFNAFVLKLYLFIPTEHPLNVYRLLLFLFFFSISSKQAYLFMTNKDCRKMGSQTWVCLVILVLEAAVAFKCAETPFPTMPAANKRWLGFAAIVYVVFTYVIFRKVGRSKTD